jgi:tetratricopeptide (TPR) repeat protein
MSTQDHSDAEHQIILHALVSYADACTLPTLTPTCPFYAVVDDRPTCGEQCRDVAEAHGAEPRKIRAKQVGGLVLMGRELPVRSVAGADSFDAAELRLRHESDEPALQPTTSLLKGLEDMVTSAAFTGSSDTGECLAYWGELERRGIPVEQVVAHGMVDTFSATINAAILTPVVIRAGISRFEDDVDAQLGSSHRDGWTQVLRGAHEASLSRPSSRTDRTGLSPDIIRTTLGRLVDPDVSDEAFKAVLEEEPFIAFMLSYETSRRISAWLTHLFNTDLEAALATSPPEHVATFAAFPAMPRDEIGRWLSDRFLLTDFSKWSSTSLTLEWRHQSGHVDSDCNPRVLAERVIDRDLVGERALAALGEEVPRASPPQLLNAGYFVRPALQAINARQWSTAVDIFRGLTEMSPTDSEAWNNLGFCSLAIDTEEGLRILEHAATLRFGNNLICAANRVLALHRLGRNEEALTLGREAISTAPKTSRLASLWAHPTGDPHQLTESTDPLVYMKDLLQHIEQNTDCAALVP